MDKSLGYYMVARYYDPETNRSRLAVLHSPTNVYYFPKRYGKRKLSV